MPLTFRVESFEGPLDVLLQLVEKQELDISKISLAQVAEQFLEFVLGSDKAQIRIDELADFLLIAAKLIYIKSKLLVPDLYDEELETGIDLETQLRIYREFVQASKGIDIMWKNGVQVFSRVKASTIPISVFSPPPEIDIALLHSTMLKIIARIQPIRETVEQAIEKVVSVQEKIEDLFSRIRTQAHMVFSDFIKATKNRSEAVASFLALLELVRQRIVRVNQISAFEDIQISTHGDATHVELVDSYI